MPVVVDAGQPRRLVVLPGPRCIRELWEWRALFLIFVRRDLGSRYGRSLVGLAWVILQPLSTMGVFTLVFGRIARVTPEGPPYTLFALSGITLWIFLRGALTAGAGSVVGQRFLVTRAYFPRLLLPAAAVAGRLGDFAVGLAVLLVVLVGSGWPLTRGMWLLAPVLVVAALFASGVAMAAAALSVRFSEVGAALPAAMQFWMYLSPVIYPASLVPERWRAWYDLNPAVGLLEAFRAAVLGLPVDWRSFGCAAAAAVVAFVGGFSLFRRSEDEFADNL